MASDFQRLAQAQRDATRALRTLTTQFRERSGLPNAERTESRDRGRALASPGRSGAQEDFDRLLAGRTADAVAETPSLRDATRALRTLTTQFRERSGSPNAERTESRDRRRALAGPGRSGVQEDFDRLLAGRTAEAAAETPSLRGLTAQGRRSSVPLIVTGERTVEEALNATARSVRNLGVSLGRNTAALEKNSNDVRDGLRSLVSGLLGAGPSQGGGGVLRLLSGGFGLATLGLKIAGLFGSRKKEAQPLVPVEFPPRLSLEAANTDNILSGFPRVVRGERGAVRAVTRDAIPAAPQVVVNISAMDSQSFLDRSGDIALAVRDAMLHMHPINDVVGEV